MISIPAIIIIALGVLICAYLIIRMWANEIKTETPKPKTGHWIFTTEGNTDYITCSICGRDSMGAFDFCPNCGSEMTELKTN